MTPDSGSFAAGRAGEDAAAAFYLRSGYELLDRNWRWGRKGEIDIVAYHKKNDILAICEVKTRSPRPLVRPCEAVGAEKQRKLRVLGEIYLLRNPVHADAWIRFDVVEIILERGGEIRLNFIENAF